MHIQLLRADVTSMKVDAIITASETNEQTVTGGNLLCKFIIQTPIPRAHDGDIEERIRVATLNALERAESLAVATVAMPAMCDGFPPDMMRRCAQVMLDTTALFGKRARSLQRVVYCLFDEGDYEVFDQALRNVKQ
jgi:O-acetyl-ADP-ribose deacetylase (regulator of RNase III)